MVPLRLSVLVCSIARIVILRKRDCPLLLRIAICVVTNETEATGAKPIQSCGYSLVNKRVDAFSKSLAPDLPLVAVQPPEG